ncbi:MAG TPA: ATPase, T2SS/T4P/T4SS family [Vicinamibacterales bacterium]|nr:ATPase, T2SS/T4P/T4SS family [Vicinamibacterales bacterium]
MSLVPSLLQAIVRVDGDALVMHAGDKPYVVSPSGQTDLASRGLSLDAVDGIVKQLLSADSRSALEEFGAVQYELPPMPEFPGEHFTVVAARGGDDLWVEVRRHRIPDEDRIPDDFFSAPAQAAPPVASAPVFAPQQVIAAATSAPSVPRPMQPPTPTASFDAMDALDALDANMHDARHDDHLTYDEPRAVAFAEPTHEPAYAPPYEPEEDNVEESDDMEDDLLLPDASQLFPTAEGSQVEDDEPDEEEYETPAAAAPAPPPPPPPLKPAAVVTRVSKPIAPAPEPVPAKAAPPTLVPDVPKPAAVLQMSRSPIRGEQHIGTSVGDPTMDGLQRLLRISAARGASTLYLSSDSQPSVRVDGELQMLDSEPVLTTRDVESLLLTLMPERSHEALRTGAPTEWICEIEQVGRVRCTTFRDHVGAGGVFRLMPTKTVTVDELGLPKAIQSLAIEPEGIILVVGPRSSGKRTLMSSLVDLINRTRRDHVITIEREISILHQRGNSFISQREVRGSDDDMLAAARAALREDPDILLVEDLRTGGLVNVALEAASSGRLVIGGFSAHTATAAIDRIIDLYAPEHRRQVQFAIADNLRGVISQVLLRRIGGGRVPAREVLLNTPAVSSVIAEGKTSSLPMAIEGGRRYGMTPFSDSLVTLVQSGVVDIREAYRHADDRGGLLAALKRQGVDTSVIERVG